MRWTMKRLMLWGGMALFIGSIVFFAYLKSKALLDGPQIILSSPQGSGATDSSLVVIAGVAQNTKEITIDGRPIFIDLSGNFYERLVLLPGYNIIELTAKDVRGVEVKKRVELVYVSPADSDAIGTTTATH